MDFKDRKWNLSVPSVRDIEAPLGGTSTVYEIVLIEGEEQFTYTRTFREIEDFARKLQKKFTTETFPVLPSGADVELKRQAAQTFLKFIGDKPSIISSSIAQQFMGQDRSVKHIVKDQNQNSTDPPATINNELYEDLFQESSYMSNKKQSNLFDDDSCELFYSTPEKIPYKPDTRETVKLQEEPSGVPEGKQDVESDGCGDEVDQLFVPRKGQPLMASDLYEESEDLFKVDDNLNDLLLTVSARAEAAKLRGSKSSNSEPREQPEASVAAVSAPQPKTRGPAPRSDLQELTAPAKPSLPVKPVLPTKPKLPSKPALKPKPSNLPPKPTVGEADSATSATPDTQKSELNSADIGSYIAAAEKDTFREVSLFDD